MTRRRLAGGACCLVLLAAGAVSCSNQDNSPTPSATSSASAASSATTGVTPAVCADIASLRASADKLKAAPKGRGSLPGLSSELAAMQTTLTQLAGDASAQFSGQVDTLKAATTALRKTVTAAKDNPSASTIAAVTADLAAVGAALDQLVRSLGDTC